MSPKDIKHKHPKIYQRVKDVCKEQGRNFIEDLNIGHLFAWDETEEGDSIWRAMNMVGSVGPWYEFWENKNKLEIL